MTQANKQMTATLAVTLLVMVLLVAIALLLNGCATPEVNMASFDRRVEQRHADYLWFRSSHVYEFGEESKKHDWFVSFWWKEYLKDKATRGQLRVDMITEECVREPGRGMWATAPGRWMIQEIDATKHAWTQRQ